MPNTPVIPWQRKRPGLDNRGNPYHDPTMPEWDRPDTDPHEPLSALRGNEGISRDETIGSNQETEKLNMIKDSDENIGSGKEENSSIHSNDELNTLIKEQRKHHKQKKKIWDRQKPSSAQGEYQDSEIEDPTAPSPPESSISSSSSLNDSLDVQDWRLHERILSRARHATVTEVQDGASEAEDEDKVNYISSPRGLQSPHGRINALVHKPRTKNKEDDILTRLGLLQRENESLRSQLNGDTRAPTPPPAIPSFRYQVLYFIDRKLYLNEPQWEPGDPYPVLLATNPIRNEQHYLDQHPELAFVFYKYYRSKAPDDESELQTKDGIFRAPVPLTQEVVLLAEKMVDAIYEMVYEVPRFNDYFPKFDAQAPIKAPYLFLYYSIPYLNDVLPRLEPISRSLVMKFHRAVEDSHGYEYLSAKEQFQKGLVAKHLIRYLIKPGDVLLDMDGANTQAFLARDWAQEVDSGQPTVDYKEDRDELDKSWGKRGTRRDVKFKQGHKNLVYTWTVPVSWWEFDGNFQIANAELEIKLKVGYKEETVPIGHLNYVPLDHAPPETRSILEKRGNMFWKCRFIKYIFYRKGDTEIHGVDERYMVDIESYKRLHPNSSVARRKLRADISAQQMRKEAAPKRNWLLLFPPTIPGFNLIRKKWVDLFVDSIEEVAWNKMAFNDLVVDPETKLLVQALVTKQLARQRSTDFINNKGTGLTLLLHGAPGTGKTFTAEGVAEFVEKPLFRVTCGDIGTQATEVERNLASSFHLGKIWDCVVLLDEADVFLEERDIKDLNRNALVSVFLRALEYYDGILILTSNRVGTFDEAFKSRIQLALHYENLTGSQRKKIWRNFFNRLKSIEESNVDYDDLIDNLDELSKEDLNGREIRNIITTARQLSQFQD